MKKSSPTASDVKLWQRLLMVALIGTVPLFIVSLVLISTSYNGSVDFVLQEQRGIAFQRPLEQLLDLVSRYQATERQTLAGDTPAASGLADLREQIDDAMALVAKNYQGDLGQALGFTDVKLALRKRENARLSVLQTDWNNLKSAPPAMAASSDAASPMIDSIREMIAHAGDLSNLILDEKLDSYYLMDLTVYALPQAQQRLSDITLQVGDWLRNGLTSANKTQIAVLADLVQQDDQNRIVNDAQTSLSENKNDYGASKSLQKNLPPAVASYASANQAFLALLNRIAAGGKVPVEEFEAAGWKARAESFRLSQVGENELDELLSIRIRSIEERRLQYYFIISFTLLFAACVMGWIIRSLLDTRYAEVLKNEEELQASAEKFAKAFQANPSGIAITDMETGRYIEVNESFCRLYGYSQPEMIGRTGLELGIWGRAEDRNRMLQSLRTSGSMRDFKMQSHTREGETKTVLTNAEQIELGGIKCIVSLVEDITERKRAEEALREKQAQLILAMDIAKLAHWEFDVAANRVTADEHLFQLLGTTSAQAGGLSMAPEEYIRKFVHPLDAGLVAREVALGVATTDPNFARQFEHRFIRADGTEGVMMARARVVQSAGGQTVKISGTSQDITEQKRTQEEMIWKTAFLEAQVDSSLDGILVVDDRAKRILQNERLFQLFKVPEDIARDDDDVKLLQHVAQQTKDPKKFSERVGHLYAHRDETGRDEIELKDGTILDRYSAPVCDKTGKYYGRIWAFREITEQRKLEMQLRQSQKMEAIGQLASGVAHDFNNILAVIQMQADLMKADGNLVPMHLEFANEIGAASQRAANLTRQLLVFSRQQAMLLRNIDLNDVVVSITKMLQRVLREDIQMQFKYASHPLFVHADAGMLDQVLMNLTVNARDAMPKGGNLFLETSVVTFDDQSVAQAPQSRPGSFACLSVSDTGTGIPPEILPQIFNPFFSTKDIGKGTGLGLATVFGIVQQHQGWINVYSEVGHGTTFRVYLPWLSAITGKDKAPRTLVSVTGGNETILLVEDDQSLRMSIHKMLSKLGYNILEAATGLNALEVWKHKRNEIDLLLTDLMMPDGMNGKELAKRLLQENPALKVIYISGYSAEIAAQDFPLEEGVNFLAKPFETEKFAKAIRNRLDVKGTVLSIDTNLAGR